MTALDRQQAAREGGQPVLSVIAGEQPWGWVSWAASRGCLALVVDAAPGDDVARQLLAAFPWPRTLGAARRRFGEVAGLDPTAVDAALDARGDDERWRWVLDAVGHDPHALVGGWVLCALRENVPRPPPLSGARLLAIACDLAAPVGVLFHEPACTARWVGWALDAGAELVAAMPRRPVAVAAPPALVRAALDEPGARRSLARQGLVELERPRAAPATATPSESGARSGAEQALFDALARDRRTAGRFALNRRIALDVEREIDLVAGRAKLAVEIDGWHHFRDHDHYRRDRHKDVVLQKAGYLVMRYLAEDVGDRLELVVDEIAIALAAREAAYR